MNVPVISLFAVDECSSTFALALLAEDRAFSFTFARDISLRCVAKKGNF
jgi:hypothetical protein